MLKNTDKTVHRNSLGNGTVLMSIADRLKEIRGKESRESFASKIGVHAQTLYRYEQGGRDIDSGVIVAVCKEFNISAQWILLGSGPMHPGDTAPAPQPQAQQPETPLETATCARCAKLEAKVEALEEERRELSAENRQLNMENKQLLRENGELKIEVAVQREQLKSLSGRSVAMDCA